MFAKSIKPLIALKLLVAVVLLTVLVALPVHEIFPRFSISELLLVCLSGTFLLLALVVGGAICSLQFSQLILRMGGTDPQWFWFASEPRGLVLQRQALATREPTNNES